ncbi:MAG: hypothetical protein ABIK09_19435 [Pseudomonadota bacterium]
MADLVDAGVAFVTVGGIACALNGYVRATEDVDILVQRTDENLGRLLGCLAGFGAGHASELTLGDFPDEEGAVRIIEDFPLDVFVRMGGRSYDDLRPNVRIWTTGPVQLPYLDLEGLIALKQESLRERDRLDVLALRALRGRTPKA